jgi:hypothetical protein
MRERGPGTPPPHESRQGRPCTLAMAAGLTDRVWTRHEVSKYHVPPWPRAHALEDAGKDDHHGRESTRCARRQAKTASRGPDILT